MSIYYPIGTALVTLDELLEKSATGRLKTFMNDMESRSREASLEFSTGLAEGPAILSNLGKDAVPWKELGKHKPLTIEIRHLYTGDSPDGKDMLVTSAIKGMTTYEGAPRAVNLLTGSVGRRSQFEAVPATEKGTFLVFYSPAILDNQASLRLEIGFDRFKKELFDTIGSALSSAGGVPIFAAYSGILVGAGFVTKLVSSLAEALIDDAPYFQEDESINIFRPGVNIPEPGYRLVTSRRFPEEELSKYQVKDGKLVDGDGRSYAGPHPYIVISLDGTPNEGYQDFTATAASAALLERFYKAKEGSDTFVPAFLDAVKLANDWKFRSEAVAVANELGSMDKQSEAYAQRKARFDSLVKSILHEELRPSLKA